MYIYYIPLVAWCIGLVLFFLPHDEVASTMPRCCEDWPFFVYPEESEEFTCEISRKISSTRNKYMGKLLWLVVYLPSWKMMDFVNGKDGIPYITQNKNMFETTNQ